MTGAVDPEVYTARLMADLEAAGIDTLRDTIQTQVDTWLANKAG